ncbi:DNA polymerase [Marinomonas vulgaris]|nr:DNA polymerase [Marinomonas vulgaris]
MQACDIKRYARLFNSIDLDVKMILQVHDELIFEVAEKDLDAAQAKSTDIMQNSSKIDVPLLVEAGVGDNWDEAH